MRPETEKRLQEKDLTGKTWKTEHGPIDANTLAALYEWIEQGPCSGKAAVAAIGSMNTQDRRVDRGLQKLRDAGLIRYERQPGRPCFWEVTRG